MSGMFLRPHEPLTVPLMAFKAFSDANAPRAVCRMSLNHEDLHIVYAIEQDGIHTFSKPQHTDQTFGIRRDGLWNSTCFELFAKEQTDDGDLSQVDNQDRGGSKPYRYIEWNLAANGDWAFYEFSAYREGQTRPDIEAPKLILSTPCRIEFRLPRSFLKDGMTIGPAMILKDGQKPSKYFAMKHPKTQPDFHDPSTYGVRLKLQ